MNSTGWGGLEMNTLKLARELLKRGVEIHQIVHGESKYASELNEDFDQILRLLKPKKYFDFKNARRVWDYLKRNNIKNVLVAYRPDLDLAAITKRKSKRSIHIIHQQHMIMGITKTGITQRYRYRAIDVWLCPLEILKPDVLQNTEVPNSKIRIAPIGLDVTKFMSFGGSKKEAQKMLGCETDAKLLGVIGRIDAKKGQLFLPGAIKKLRELGENVELLIVGTPTLNDPTSLAYMNELKESIKENDLSDYVHFSNFMEDVRLCYAAIDVLVLPSLSETYGMVTLEAMLSKTPVLGTNSGGTPEILDFGKLGELYEVSNLDDFVLHYQKLQQRLANGELNLDFVQSEIAEKYSIEQEVSAVLDAMI